MGIKNLIKIIEKYSPSSIKYKKISDYSHKTLAIDFNLMLYKSIYAVRGSGKDIKNGNIIVTHIHTLVLKLISFKKYDITPIFVFDGKVPVLKYDTMKKRDIAFEKLHIKYKTATTKEDKKKYYIGKTEISNKELEDCRKILKLCGCPIIDAVEEAEAVCVQLAKNGLVDGIVSDDMDVLLFGGAIMLKKFTTSTTKYIQQINLHDVLKDLKINMKQLIDIGILLGCDYCEDLSGQNIGILGAYDKIVKYGNIRSLLKNNIINIDYMHYKNVRNYFINPVVNKNIKLNNIIPKPIDKTNLIIFLKKFEFTDTYFKKYIADL